MYCPVFSLRIIGGGGGGGEGRERGRESVERREEVREGVY